MSVVPITQTPARFNPADNEQLELLKRTLAVDLTDDEFALFGRVCDHTGLDPFRRQIYAIRRSGWMTIQTGIDGFRAIAARTGQYAGQDDATFDGKSLNKQYPGMATVTVYKLIGGMRCPFTASARWDEYVPPDNQMTMWRKMPHNQLAKCAEALALRKAFPEETSGVLMEDSIAFDLDAATIPPVEHEPTREELVTQAYQALSVNEKVAYKVWKDEQSFESPPSETDLDAIEVKLQEIVGAGEPGASQPTGDTDAVPSPQAASGDSPAPGETSALGGDAETDGGRLLGEVEPDPVPHGMELWSKSDLLDEAREIGLDVTDSWTKPRLATAIRAWNQAYRPDYEENEEGRPF